MNDMADLKSCLRESQNRVKVLGLENDALRAQLADATLLLKMRADTINALTGEQSCFTSK